MVIWWGPKVPRPRSTSSRPSTTSSRTACSARRIPALGDKIALTAWTGDPAKYYVDGNYGMGHIAICSSFDQKAFAAFRSAYRGKGPEGIPTSANEPGMGPQ